MRQFTYDEIISELNKDYGNFKHQYSYGHISNCLESLGHKLYCLNYIYSLIKSVDIDIKFRDYRSEPYSPIAKLKLCFTKNDKILFYINFCENGKLLIAYIKSKIYKIYNIKDFTYINDACVELNINNPNLDIEFCNIINNL